MRLHARILLSVVCLLLLVTSAQGQTAASSALAAGSQRAHIVEGYGRLPLAFEANQGQTDSQVKFISRGSGYALFLTPAEAVLTLQPSAVSTQHSGGAVLRMKLLNANPQTTVSGESELPGRSNYFIGSDPKKWHRDVRQYAKVRYANVYPGVDLVYYGNQRELEYDFVVQPGARPEAIRIGIEGTKRLRLERGDLVMTAVTGDVRLRSPRIYQEVNGSRHRVHGRYVMTGKNKIGFRVFDYDRKRALIIDPVLAYSTFLGYCYATSVAIDSVGSAYVTGNTGSTHFPTVGSIQPYAGGQDGFVTKFNVDGSGLVYSTYLGGTGNDYGQGIAIDSTGDVYVTGDTSSSDFPVIHAAQPTYGGVRDAFITKINSDGSALVYSTYLGGSGVELGLGIAVDSAANAYITGLTQSTDFPTINAMQQDLAGVQDAFVSKLNASGSALVYSTYLGGSGTGVGWLKSEEGFGIAVDAAGDAYVVGATDSADFPTFNAIQATNAGGADAFVTEINTAGSGFVYSTYLGGINNDVGFGIAADSAGAAYVSGSTESWNFPTVNAMQSFYGGNLDAFVTKINPGGNSLAYSTYLGGGYYEYGYGIAVDPEGSAYVSGETMSLNFPLVNPIQSKRSRRSDAFVSKFTADGRHLVYSTYFGGDSVDRATGIAVNSAGSAYVTGMTLSQTKFPITPLAFQQSNDSGGIFVAKIASQSFVNVSPAKLTFPVQALGTASAAKKVTLTNQGAASLTISRIYIGATDPSDFAETNTCGSSLAPNTSCTISITFIPTDKNTRKAAVGISDSDPASPQAIALTGTGTFVSLSTKSVKFGKVPVGTTSSPITVTLTNVGNVQLNFTDISITGANAGDFAQTNTCAASIGAGGNCTITVSFTPAAAGARKGTISISDDGGGSPQKITLTGTGT